MSGITAKAREKFANQILEDFKSKITGSQVNRVIDKNPEEIFFVGKLMSVNDNENNNAAYSSKTFIESISVDFYISEDDLSRAKLKIYPQGDFYYRVYPTLEEQQNALLKIINKKSVKIYETFDEIISSHSRNCDEFKEYGVKLVPVFKKLQIHKERHNLEVDLSEIVNITTGYGYMDKQNKHNITLSMYLEDLQNEINNDPERYSQIIAQEVKVEDLLNKVTYDKFLQTNAKQDVKINQNWSLYIDLIAKKIKNKYLISITLVNDSRLFSGVNLRRKKEKFTLETLFNSGIEIELINAEFSPIIMDYFLDDYKYNRFQEALGTNCTVVFNRESNTIKTEHLPTFIQKRLVTNDKLAIKFEDLINDPISILKNIKKKMDKELFEWINYKNSIICNLSSKAREKITSEIREFELEIRRYEFGIYVIKNYPHVYKSFLLMNKTFFNSAKGYSTWRLFQIVFIVSIIPDIVACDENTLPLDEKQKTNLGDMALLYFPTGGGKTEAFLGALVFNLFFDRFRGKHCGVTCILRYPLRLLSVQQVQRLANILAQAELLRREEPEINKTCEFSLGYFVGDGNTPNKLSKEEVVRYREMTQDQRDENRVIDICPYCGGNNIHIYIDEKNYKLVHFCKDTNCASGGILPIYIVDNEIYRYLPSTIISTVDKLAILGNNRNFRNIINGAVRKCPKHGYTTTQSCVEKQICDVEANEFEEVDMYDPAPTLFIQDELHLIRESLGTYASHYESFLDYYIKNLSKSKRGVKIIGATATISSYELQVHHLYNRDAIRFPSASPYLNKNFYSYIDENDTQRIILGYAPFGKAIINSVVYSLKYMREVINEYLIDEQKVISIPEIGIATKEDAKKLLEDYWIFLEYNNVKRDGNNVEGALETPVNVELQDQGITPFITRKMTGDETFQDVRELLSQVENSKEVFEGVNLIAATSMISHGVDADRFNVMFFYGIPGNTAEYIQAYSRTGRKHSSIVIDLIRPSRETDQSYLKNFVKFHEYKDILVEAVPINRWATRAIENTLPGIFSGLLLSSYDEKLQYITGTLFFMKNLKIAILQGHVKKDIIKKQLEISYGCSDGNIYVELGNQYKEKIHYFIDTIFEQISDRSWMDENIFSGFSLMGYRIMNSLRDTDTQLIIELE